MSLVGEFYHIVKGFFMIADAYNHVVINKHQSKTLSDRRNHIMNTIKTLADSSVAKSRLEAFDQSLVTFMTKFTKKNIGFKMLFNKSDHAMFAELNQGLDDIVKDFPRLSALKASTKTIEDARDVLCDFKGMKEYFMNNLDGIPVSDKVEIKANLVEYLPIVQSVAAPGASLGTVFDSSLSVPDLASVDDDIDFISSALEDVSVSNAVPAAQPILSPSARQRAETSADERAGYVAFWTDWLKTHIPSIRPSKRLKYADTLYDSDVTTELRLRNKLAKEPAWLTGHGVDEEDAADILEYLSPSVTAPLVPAKAASVEPLKVVSTVPVTSVPTTPVKVKPASAVPAPNQAGITSWCICHIHPCL